MTDMILIYITCKNMREAKSVGKHLLTNKLCGCINIFPEMQPMFFWPPKSGTLEEGKEVVLIAKTLESKYQDVENEIHRISSYDVPCIFAIPVANVDSTYYEWIRKEIEG